jgi:hypothetical protein
MPIRIRWPRSPKSSVQNIAVSDVQYNKALVTNLDDDPEDQLSSCWQ